MKFTLRKALAISLLVISSLATTNAWSGVAVIVHPNNGSTLTEADIKRIFLGKKKSFPGGGSVLPVDQKEGSAVRIAFMEKVLKKNEQQVKAYWAQRLFTGKGSPPKVADTAADTKKLVAENPSTISYIDSSEADDTVKIVYQF